MYLHFLKVFYENNIKYRFVSGISVLGLVLGLLSTMLILEYVLYERSYEDYNQNASHIYRVAYNRYQDGKLLWKTANSFFPTGYYLKENFAEVEDFAVIQRNYNITVSHENQLNDNIFFNEEKTYYATNSVFKFFDIQILNGDSDCLVKPYTVAISERAAKKYFGDENPIGKTLMVNYAENYTVTAIFKTIPQNTHLKSDFFFSMQTLISRNPVMMKNWNYDYFYTYLMLRPGTDYKAFAAKAFPKLIEENYIKYLTATNSQDDIYLQPIQDIHLKSSIEYETEKPVNGNLVSILFGFSIFFLVVAWINYANMITARAVERAREVGIKKVHGVKRSLLVLQFIGEAFILNSICFFVALFITIIINPFYVTFTSIQPFTLSDEPLFFVIGIIVFVAGIILSSIYPAFVLSSYQPVDILKGVFKNTSKGIFFRKTMLTFQFIISLILLIGTLAAYEQVRYLAKKDMGINYMSTMVVSAPKRGSLADEYNEKLRLFKTKMEQSTQIKGITLSSDVPGREINHWMVVRRKGYSPDDSKAYFSILADDDFFNFYKIKFLAGRGFRKDDLPEQRNIIMNLSAVKRLGYNNAEEALNQIVIAGPNLEFKVVGITEDFYYYSKKIEPVPTIMRLNTNNPGYISIKMNSGATNNRQEFINKIKSLYDEVFTDRPFEYFFLEDEMARDIKPDNTYISIFGYFSVIAIFISVIGILGLLLITINQNMKELAIRKAIGAGIIQTGILISKSLFWPFIIASVIAVPLTYFGIKNWFLTNYVHPIDLNVGILFYPLLLILLVIASILIFISIKINNIKIAEVLQYE